MSHRGALRRRNRNTLGERANDNLIYENWSAPLQILSHIKCAENLDMN